MQTAILCSDHQKWLSESAKKLLRSTKSNFPNHVDQHGHHLSYLSWIWASLVLSTNSEVTHNCENFVFVSFSTVWMNMSYRKSFDSLCIFSSILFNWRYSTYVGAVEKDLPLTEILLDEEDSYPQLTKSWKLNLEHAVG